MWNGLQSSLRPAQRPLRVGTGVGDVVKPAAPQMRAGTGCQCLLPPPPAAASRQRRGSLLAAAARPYRERSGRPYREGGGRPMQRGRRRREEPEWAEGREREPDLPQDDMERWMDRLASMRPSMRSVALLRLLRIEHEGAYSGLVGGSPRPGASAGNGSSKSGRSAGRRGGGSGADEWDSDEEDSAGGRRDRAPVGARLDPRDQRGVTELVNGVTRWRRRLDFTLGALSSRPLAELDPPLLCMLRVGLYELAEMKAPSHTINEHVELAKQLMHPGTAAVVNGLLRNVVRRLEAGTLPQPPPPTKGMPLDQAAEALAVGSSHPTWMVKGWLQQYGPAGTMALLRANNKRPHFSLRLCPGQDVDRVCARLQERGAQVRPSRHLPREFIVVEGGMQALLTSGLVERGEAQVQDEAAGLVVSMLDPQPGDTILDACAAPGGKALFAAARMGGQGRILALDVAPARLAALKDMARRQEEARCVRLLAGDLRQLAAAAAAQRGEAGEAAGAAAGAGEAAAAEAQDEEEEVEVEKREQGADEAAGPAAASESEQAAEEGEEPSPAPSSRAGPAAAAEGTSNWHTAPLPTAYDRVLLDAPCSGTGVLAKRADLRWKRSPEQVEELVALQAELLDAAASLVAPGGLLVYSTCSIERAENEGQVEAFLERHPQFAEEAPPAAAGIPAECLSAEGRLAMLPHVQGADGAFAARLRHAG